MIKLSFEINSLPSLNEYINLERSNKYIAASLKKKITNLVHLMALSQIRSFEKLILPLKYKQNAFFVWETENNKQDSDNVFFAKKFILDGLVNAKLLEGDGRKYINHCFDFIQTTGKKKVTLFLIDENDTETNIELFRELLK